MSNRRGRCFRAGRRTRARKLRQALHGAVTQTPVVVHSAVAQNLLGSIFAQMSKRQVDQARERFKDKQAKLVRVASQTRHTSRGR